MGELGKAAAAWNLEKYLCMDPPAWAMAIGGVWGTGSDASSC